MNIHPQIPLISSSLGLLWQQHAFDPYQGMKNSLVITLLFPPPPIRTITTLQVQPSMLIGYLLFNYQMKISRPFKIHSDPPNLLGALHELQLEPPIENKITPKPRHKSRNWSSLSPTAIHIALTGFVVAVKSVKVGVASESRINGFPWKIKPFVDFSGQGDYCQNVTNSSGHRKILIYGKPFARTKFSRSHLPWARTGFSRSLDMTPGYADNEARFHSWQYRSAAYCHN